MKALKYSLVTGFVGMMMLHPLAFAENQSEARGFSQPWVLLGIDSGFTGLDTRSSSELNQNGFQVGFKGLAAFYWKNWVFDGGLGWFYNRLTGSSSGPTLSIDMRTRAAFAEISPRYRLTERFQLGLVGQTVFGTDLSYAPESRDRKNLTVLGGLQAMYDINYDSSRLRFSLQLMTDTNVQERQVYLVIAGVQFGLPLTRTTASHTPIIRQAKVVQEPKIRRVLDIEQLFHFETNSDRLRAEDRKILEQIGTYLSKSQAWESLTINGHTDERGSRDYNLGLSERRARTVRDTLIAGGVQNNRLKAQGFSEDKPLVSGNNPRAWAVNRRVELVFAGLEDPDFIDRLIEIKNELTRENELKKKK